MRKQRNKRRTGPLMFMSEKNWKIVEECIWMHEMINRFITKNKKMVNRIKKIMK